MSNDAKDDANHVSLVSYFDNDADNNNDILFVNVDNHFSTGATVLMCLMVWATTILLSFQMCKLLHIQLVREGRL